MSSAAPQRSYGQKGFVRNQKRFVPKSDNTSSSSSSLSSRDRPTSSNNVNPPPPLTTSLRGSSPARTRSADNEKRHGNFVNYLPQDEAVASGLGVEEGGLDAVESQRVVDLLNDELSRLLKMKPREFWKEVASNDSLHDFLDSYLQFRNRWYDFPHHGARGTVAGVIVGELELCRRVFMVFYRMSSNKDPGARVNDCLSMKEHAALLQEKKLLDLPKLLDICAIYGHENGEMTGILVTNAMKAQPMLHEKFSAILSHFLSIAHTMHQRCCSSVEVLVSSGASDDHRHGQLHADLLEVMDFINDAIATLDAFVDAYKPAAIYFSCPIETSYGSEELLSTLARLHDSLLPSLQQGFKVLSNAGMDGTHNLFGGALPNIYLSLKILSTRLVKFGWNLLDSCYLSDELMEDSLPYQTAMKMFPAKVEDPVIRGDILIQTFREINAEVSYHFQENNSSGTFLQNVEKNFKILRQINSLRSNGWIFMEEEQFQYLSQIATPVSSKFSVKEPIVQVSSSSDKVQMDEDAVITESKISQIKDLFPDYGKGFLSACLEVYNQNSEEVIQRILEGTLHEDLLSLDTSLEQVPPPKSASHSKSNKGKGALLESASQTSSSPSQAGSTMGRTDADGPTSSFSSYGRYTRKTEYDLPDTKVLDSRTAKDEMRSAVLTAEYDDEYDDSFDDLGLSVVGSGFEETENLTDRNSSLQEKSWGSETQSSSQKPSSRWNSQKKPQFYVKDGKNYSYKVSGSVAVFNAQDAAVVNQAQREVIHGLGRGGNIPLGAVKKLTDGEEQEDDQISDATEDVGRGNLNPRGRGGRRGGRNHYHKDRAMKKHFAGLGGY